LRLRGSSTIKRRMPISRSSTMPGSACTVTKVRLASRTVTAQPSSDSQVKPGKRLQTSKANLRLTRLSSRILCSLARETGSSVTDGDTESLDRMMQSPQTPLCSIRARDCPKRTWQLKRKPSTGADRSKSLSEWEPVASSTTVLNL